MSVRIPRCIMKCDYCSLDIEVPRWKILQQEHHFCSRDCAHAWRVANDPDQIERMAAANRGRTPWNKGELATLICEWCSNPFDVPPSVAHKRTTCSWTCRAALLSTIRGENHHSWKSSVALVCEWCGTSFDVKPHAADTRRFCSQSCVGKWNGDVRTVDRVVIVCEQCNCIFEVHPFRSTTARFCSISCGSIWRNRHAPNISSIEWIVAAELDSRSIAYEQQVMVAGWLSDFVSDNTVIEVDGDYWHNLPGVPERDALKDIDYRALGYDVIRIWEHEINDGDFSKLDALVR